MACQEQECEAQLIRLRKAAKIGIADIGSGSFQSFDEPEQLRRHLGELARDAMSGYNSRLRPGPEKRETGSGSTS